MNIQKTPKAKIPYSTMLSIGILENKKKIINRKFFDNPNTIYLFDYTVVHFQGNHIQAHLVVEHHVLLANVFSFQILQNMIYLNHYNVQRLQTDPLSDQGLR